MSCDPVLGPLSQFGVFRDEEKSEIDILNQMTFMLLYSSLSLWEICDAKDALQLQ